MNRIILIQRIFILILIGICVAAFSYSPLSDETKWLNTTTSTTIKNINTSLSKHEVIIRHEVKNHLRTRPDNRSIILPIDTIFDNLQRTKTAIHHLFKNHQIDSINQLLDRSYEYNQSLLLRLATLNRIITKEEVDELLLRNSRQSITKYSDYDTIIYHLNYQNWEVVHFLKSKSEGVTFFCGFPQSPILKIPWVISQDETVQGQIYLPAYGDVKYSISVNEKSRLVKDGVTKMDTVFTTAGKHSIPVKIDYIDEQVIDFQTKKIFKAIRDTFDIYVFDKAKRNLD
jgi:hypothetical protein